MYFGASRGFFESGWAQAERFLKAVGRKPSGEESSVVFHARTLRKPLDIKTHRAACAAPLSFADHQEMQLHQCPDLTVLGASPPDQSGKGKVNGTICCFSRKLTTAPSVASASSNEISFGMVLRRPRQRKFRQVPGTSSALCLFGSWGAHQPGFVYVLVVDTG